jgi:FixJ family two-component response regulator
MPKISGIEVHRQLRREGSDLPVIFHTGHADVATAVSMMREGAFDFLEKPCNDQYLIERVQAAIAKNLQSQQHNSEQSAIAAQLKTLSPRELDVVHCLMAGGTSKAIAGELGINLKTVDFHRANIMRKAGAETVAKLVQVLIRGRYSKENHLLSRTRSTSLAAL